MAKCNKIRHIVRIRQMLRAWRNKAAASPSDVPAGHVAICVGISQRRFVVRASHLNHPVFRRLLSQAEEEYGFANTSGPLAIPCDESLFEEILRLVSEERGVMRSSCCQEGLKLNNGEFSGESWPLLYA